ncbi:MAG: NlpC/P60 family protein [Ferrimicrobium sp.]|nr:NlpC/P60 family protein [Ferrimicrobium sp.]
MLGAAVGYPTLLTARAYGGTLQSDQNRAKAIAGRINFLDNQVQVYAEEYDQAQTQLGQLRTTMTDTQQAITREQRRVSVLHSEVVAEADTLFMQGGTGTNVTTLLQASPNSAALIQEDINTATGAQEEALANYDTAQQVLNQQYHQLHAEGQQVEATVALIAANRSKAQNAQSQAVDALNQVNQQIQQLVYQEQQAVVKQREAQAAAQLAIQQAQAQQPSTAQTPSSQASPQPSGPTPGTASATSIMAQAAQEALQIVNAHDTTYVWGGAGEWSNGLQDFDCSGLVMYIYAKLGVDFPHSAADQASDTTPISYSQLQPGDLVFYDTEGATSIDHVAIYVGNGQVVEATNPGRAVSLDPITWSGTPVQYGTINS